MKVVIISDVESLALLDSLELEKMRESNTYPAGDENRKAREEAHRCFHYVVCRWLQSVGAETVRR